VPISAGPGSSGQTFSTTADLTIHAADTTSVHGITNTAVLETTTGADAKVAAHAALSDPHTGYVREGALFFSVDDYGATGDGVTNDSAAIRTAAAAAFAAGADLCFPQGTYLVSRVDVNTAYCLAHPGGRWFGPGTLKMDAGQSGFTRIVHPTGNDATLDGLTLDGNRANQGTSTDQRHGVFVTSVSGFTAKDCIIRDCDGDGITLGASLSGITITRNSIIGNARSGVALVYDGTDIDISHNTISGNDATPIDGESEEGHYDDVRIIGNYLVAPTSADLALAAAGSDYTTNVNNRWLVSGNNLSGGAHLLAAKNIQFVGNTVVSSGTTWPCVDLTATEGSVVVGNYIKKTDGSKPGILAQVSTITPTAISIIGNRIESEYFAIELRGVKRAIVSGNTITSLNGLSNGIYVYATSAVNGVVITGNTIRNHYQYAITLTMTGANTMKGVVVRNNIYVDDQTPVTMTTGLRLSGTASQYSDINYGDNIAAEGVSTLVSDGTAGGPVALKAGFYETAPIAKQTGVAVSAAGIHAALVNLGLIGA
jgi:parallel beta-helix repeat protein